MARHRLRHGAFSELIAQHCAPKSLSGIDRSPQQIAFAQARLPQADLRVADSMALPFGDGAFDVVASALVLHFIPDRSRASAEMKRVTRPGGVVAAYTWERSATEDFAPYARMLHGFAAIGVEATRSPAVPEAQLDGMRASVKAAGLSDIETTQIEAAQSFRSFDEYWEAAPHSRRRPTGRARRRRPMLQQRRELAVRIVFAGREADVLQSVAKKSCR
jgi:SAM-dependent methyltransferase